MKQTENNEIDLLLRDLARREGSIAPEDHTAKHLDADELNAYAEQALPAAARTRYTLHLAECMSCRKIVVELTSASGAVVSQHTVPRDGSAGVWQKLSALFSPAVLRFAVPAVALFAFMVVGLVVLNQRRETDFVAQNQPRAASDGALETKRAPEPRTEPENIAEGVVEPRSTESETRDAKTRESQTKTGERKETANTAVSTDSLVTSEKNTAPARAADAVAQPSYAPEPPPASPPKPESTHTEARTEVAAGKKEADKRDEFDREQEGARSGREDSTNRVGALQSGSPSLAVGQNQQRSRNLEAKSASGGLAKAKDNEADTRSVSGRQFRRQRGVWVDTAYQSSVVTTTLTRGSEQFRALVADEPGIRAIASQLDGEVVVVWKGRAYRIR